jgi:LysM repeat protein
VSEKKIKTDNISDIENKHNNNKKEKSDKEEKSIEYNSDIIIREDAIIIPPPIKIHTVEMGDTLYSISKQYGCSVEELIAWNPQLNNILKTGDKLQITKH